MAGLIELNLAAWQEVPELVGLAWLDTKTVVVAAPASGGGTSPVNAPVNMAAPAPRARATSGPVFVKDI